MSRGFVGPHRAALSLVTDRETKGQLWACPLYSDPGCCISRQSPGSLCGSHSLFWWSDLKLGVFVGALTLTSVHPLQQEELQYRDGMEKEVNRGMEGYQVMS